MKDHSAFLSTVESYVRNFPEVSAYISDYVARGLDSALQQAYERAADMEVALSVQMAKRYPKRNDLTKEKLAKWQGKTALNWDWFVSEPKP